VDEIAPRFERVVYFGDAGRPDDERAGQSLGSMRAKRKTCSSSRGAPGEPMAAAVSARCWRPAHGFRGCV
jgi:hypothetical protein